MKYHNLKDINNNVPKAGSFKHFLRIQENGGRVVKGVNTTADVGTDGIKKQAAKFGNTVDKDGRPPTLSKKVKGSKTNVLFNLGMSESVDNTHESVLYYSKMAENLGELASTSKVYVDMDGVLADFFGEWQKLIGSDWRKVKDIEPALQKIRDKDNFWLDLPLLPQAKNLLGVIKKVKGSYTILSSPLPNDPNSEPHKREWIKKNLSFFPPENVIITHDKPKYAVNSDGTPNILIDDFGKNIASWEAAGGEGFKHKDHKFERTAKAIKQHMSEPVEEESVQEWAVPALKGGKYALKIGNWLWRNKWAIGFFVGAWKTIDWVGDALAWLEKWLNHPVTKALGKYGLPAIGIAVALYGGKRLWDELENIKDERELDKMVRSFVPNPQEVEKELEEPIAEEDKINKKIVQKAQGMMKPMYSSEIAAMVEDEFEAIREAALKRYKKSNGKIDLYTAYTMAIEDEFPEIPNPIFVFQYMTDPVDPNHQDIVPQEAEDGSWADRADKEYQQNPKDGGFDGKIKGRWFAIKADRDSYMDQGMEPEDALDKAAERHGVDPEEVEKWIAAGNAVKIKERKLTKGEEKKKEKNVKGMKKNKDDFEKRYGKESKAVMYATATKMAKESLLWSIETGQDLNESIDKIIQVLEEMDRRSFLRKESIDENFADGKKKGKSKPGRVKKSGASCSSSVTELRKKAKNASGERAKMYHWCANMKSGKKK
jgi:5'(3')-deoxyribonucleotidase